MPIYEYECKSCGTTINKFFKSVSEGSSYLPTCACKKKMQKIISASNFHLKGDGWYATKDRRLHKEDT